jgi:2-keto-4-pentenoate hydratase/2-oxohepta-3-ene-1,7-dioic acid hydratase in catechol pathway
VAFALGSFSAAGSPPFAGLVIGDRVLALHALEPLARRLGVALRGRTMLEVLEHWVPNCHALTILTTAMTEPAQASLARRALPAGQLRTHAPVQPRQIFCAGANYRKHVIDLILDQPVTVDAATPREERRRHAEALMDHRAAKGKPFVFAKLPSCLAGPMDDILLPFDMQQADWELELVAVIGKPARRVPAARALEYVAGYTIGNDLTGREMLARPDLPSMGHDWLAGKCAPTFLALGPYIVPSQFVADPQRLQITLRLNGQIMQDESTADMIFPVARLIEWISTHVQLLPGDLIMTGSPSGNGTHHQRFLQVADVLEGTLTGLGTQRNRCIAEQVDAEQAQVRFRRAERYPGVTPPRP